MDKPNKTDLILNYMMEHGSITSLDAFYKFQATRLSAVIFNLKKKGFRIDTVMERSDKGAPYARYVLQEGAHNS